MVRDLTGKHPKYFEATIQLRDVSEEVKQFVEEEIVRSKIVVVKVERIKKIKGGFDYYLADNNQARQLSKKLQQKFGGHLLVTASLQTKKDNKELYRTTHLFREAPFRKGNNVEYQGEEYKVLMMMKDIILKHEKTGKKIHIKYKDMKNIRKI